MRDSSTFWSRSVEMGNEKHDSALDMSEVWNGLQRSDCNDSGPTSLAKLLNWAGGHSNPQDVSSGLQDYLLSKGAKWDCWFAS